MKPQPIPMFTSAQDTPLFSGTPQRATMPKYNPQPAPMRLFSSCPVCLGTGIIKPYKNKPAKACPTCKG